MTILDLEAWIESTFRGADYWIHVERLKKACREKETTLEVRVWARDRSFHVRGHTPEQLKERLEEEIGRFATFDSKALEGLTP